MKLDDAGIPIRTHGFAKNLVKPKLPEPKMVEVYYGRCKHKMMVKMWMLGKADADGMLRTRKPFEQCPECERIDAKELSERDTGGDSE